MDKTKKWDPWWMSEVVMVIAMLCLVAGCTTTDLGSLATPARIEAVTAFGAYKGAQAAISKGHADEIKSARDALLVIQKSEKVDLAAVVLAIQKAGVSIAGTDGDLAVQAGLLVFSDFWSGSVENVVEDQRARAVVAGVVRGFGLALDEAGKRGVTSENDLRTQVERTRPARR